MCKKECEEFGDPSELTCNAINLILEKSNPGHPWSWNCTLLNCSIPVPEPRGPKGLGLGFFFQKEYMHSFSNPDEVCDQKCCKKDTDYTQYELANKTGISDDTLDFGYTLSIEHCQNWCQMEEDKGCVGWTFYAWNNECHLMKKIIKATSAKEAEGHIRMYSGSVDCSKCQLRDNYKYEGGYEAIEGAEKRRGVFSCANWCASTPNCDGFEYKKSDKFCYPKTLSKDNMTMVHNTNFIAGNRDCAREACEHVGDKFYYQNQMQLPATQTDTWWDCARWCRDVVDCEYWVYKNSHSQEKEVDEAGKNDHDADVTEAERCKNCKGEGESCRNCHHECTLYTRRSGDFIKAPGVTTGHRTCHGGACRDRPHGLACCNEIWLDPNGWSLGTFPGYMVMQANGKKLQECIEFCSEEKRKKVQHVKTIHEIQAIKVGHEVNDDVRGKCQCMSIEQNAKFNKTDIEYRSCYLGLGMQKDVIHKVGYQWFDFTEDPSINNHFGRRNDLELHDELHLE